MEPNMDIMTIDNAWDGYTACARGKGPNFIARVAWAHKVFYNTDGLPVHLAQARLIEALGTADFPYLLGTTLQQELIAEFQETEPVMEQVFQKTTRPDFNSRAAIRLDGADTMLQEIGQDGMYTDADMAETAYQYKLQQWGKKIPLSWRMILADRLNAFAGIPRRFGRGARRTREFFLTKKFWDASGPLDTFFDVTGQGQDGVSNLPLNAANLGTALSAFLQYTDNNGQPINVMPKYLVVGPSLYQTAIELVEPQTLAVIATGVGNSAASLRQSASNAFIKKFNLTVLLNPWLPLVVTTSGVKDKTWALFADPSDIAAGEVATLEGEAGPQIFMKVSNQQRVGGSVDPMGGSFENDSIEYKVRDVFGATTMSPQAGWASDGQ